MLYELNQYISNSLTEVFTPSIGQRVKYTANTVGVGITAGNTSLSGGTLGTDIFVLIKGASNGTFVRTINVKATTTTVRGMVRIFIADSDTSPTYKDLVAEIDVPEVTIAGSSAPGYGMDSTFATTLQTDFMLQSGLVLLVSATDAGFIVIAEGLDTTFP